VFITAGPMIKLCAGGGGGQRRTCAMRYDEPRRVWSSLPITRITLWVALVNRRRAPGGRDGCAADGGSIPEGEECALSGPPVMEYPSS